MCPCPCPCPWTRTWTGTHGPRDVFWPPLLVGRTSAQHDHLPMSTSMCPCVPVSVSMSMVLISTNKIINQYLRLYFSIILLFLLIYLYYYIIMDVDIGRFFIHMFVDIFSIQHFLHQSALCPIRRFVPFGVFSIQRFFYSVYLTIRPFVPIGIFSIRPFVPFGVFSIKRFVPFGILSFDILSFDVFYFRLGLIMIIISLRFLRKNGSKR
jgi:hypothetical protein